MNEDYDADDDVVFYSAITPCYRSMTLCGYVLRLNKDYDDDDDDDDDDDGGDDDDGDADDDGDDDDDDDGDDDDDDDDEDDDDDDDYDGVILSIHAIVACSVDTF